MDPNKIASCLIIEDEAPAATILRLHIDHTPSLQLAGVCTSIRQAQPFLQAGNLDLVFLDINLPGLSGIDFAKTQQNLPALIFTTAYSEYAVEGFNVQAVDFLLKPISFERFSQAVQRFWALSVPSALPSERTSSESARPFVLIKCDRQMMKIFTEEILYLEAQRNYLLICTKTEVFKTYQSISEMEEKLPEPGFLRIHRSFIISLANLNGFSHKYVWLHHLQLPIGRMYQRRVLAVLEKETGLASIRQK
ncbi:LytR/AlgR family response regulator transcription factor [Rufibacter roseolus]|uniref:LytR/AlgR family response regulator transcription factor n=1 Tax=Rufibacter roseolus TaxID=2817375 RepID=UPI001B3181FE|nr:LytTR family DNA-binding domain-containing protein [Rufibacter roseolus]